MRVVNCFQGSAEWLQVRVGRITASRIVDVLARLKNGSEGADRRNYRVELAAERLTGRSEEFYVSPEMQWGTENESFARASYEIARGVMTDQLGFVIHPTMDFAGASPDSLVDEDGGLEIKCPKSTTHIKWMQAGGVPEEHQPQMLWNMACTGRAWWDFASYDPRLPEEIRLYVARMERDEKRIAEVEAEVVRFNAEVDFLIGSLGVKVYKPSYYTPTEKTADEMMRELADELIGDIVP